MSASAKEALRLAAVDTFRAAAATGLTTRERMKLLQENWAQRAQDTNPFRFVDRAGRRWENARYVQMLARTTAQRVQTAAFCDSMLRGGYPLARISHDSGDLQCGVCSAWEGRLIDLTAGNEFKKYGAVPLRAAREAGVFHPNCTHRLEYLSPTEYPKGAWDEFTDRVGEPGAFGNPRKTNAGGETVASAKRRAQQAAKAAEERARKDAQASPIGKAGTWQSLGLPPGKELPTAPAEPRIAVAEALERLARVEIVVDPLGREIRFGLEARKHIGKRGRDAAEEKRRLEQLDRAEGTVRHPLEIWKDPDSGREKYIRLILDEQNARTVLNVVTEEGDHTYSWHSNSVSLDHYRAGLLLYQKP